MTPVNAKIKDHFVATFADEEAFLTYLTSFTLYGKWKRLYLTVYPQNKPSRDLYEEYKLKAVFDLPRILVETPMNNGLSLAEFLERNIT